MADFAANVAKSGLLFGELGLQKFFAARKLAGDNSGAGLPGKREPGEKSWAVALGGPIFAFERGGESRAAFGGGGEYTAVGASRRLTGVCDSNHSGAREFFHGVIKLRARNVHPIAPLAALEFGVGLIAVHGAFG